MNSFHFFAAFFLFSAVYAQNIDVRLSFSRERDEAAIEKVSKVVKRINSDNRFAEAKLHEIDCSNDPSSEECKSIDGFHLSISSSDAPTLKVQRNVPQKNLHELSDVATELLYEFVDGYFSHFALESTSKIDKEKNSKKDAKFWEEFELKTSKDLDQVISSGKSTYSFVLFYFPEDFENYEAVVHFADALRRTKASGGLINCHKNEEICKEYNVLDGGFSASLIAYHNENPYKNFEGTFDGDNVRDWILTIQQPDIAKMTEDLVPLYRSGIIPGFEESRSTVNLLFVAKKRTAVYTNFKKFAKENHGRFHFGAMVHEDVLKWAHNPAFVTMKPLEEYIQAFTLYDDLSYDRMVEYLEESIRPSVHKIETAKNLKFALSGEKPLIVFVDPTATRNSTNFRWTAGNQLLSRRIAYFAVSRGFDLFGMYWTQKLADRSKPFYISIKTEGSDYCLHRKSIANEDENQILHWIKSLKDEGCEELIPRLKLPLDALELRERKEETEKIVKEMLEKTNKHEEL
ncbi:unnamed protein product [Caenorhabditis auriculariae]|uniref:Thioredoxin domain-containing protein n=1 Tax=Caenorhabditis auriculariae TaxID=2777116 RepID=A0A8S1H674_9PELO|nr:unnamed protein product [Caenorhabditis auriculariae]